MLTQPKLVGTTIGLAGLTAIWLAWPPSGGSGRRRPAAEAAPASGPRGPTLAGVLRPLPPGLERSTAASRGARTAPSAASASVPGRTLVETYASIRQELSGLTYAQLLARRAVPYLPAHGLDIGKAEHLEKLTELTPSDRALLARHGFVILPLDTRTDYYLVIEEEGRLHRGRHYQYTEHAGPVDVLYKVFARKLPVFLSADAILHAWHRSFDALLRYLEESRMRPLLQMVLRRTLDRLDLRDPAQRDAALVLAVARALLEPGWTVPRPLGAEVRELRRRIDAGALARVSLLGEPTDLDLGQLRPRGHYAETWFLRTYFRAMMWLGQVRLVLHDPGRPDRAPSRMEAAARALAHALARGKDVDLALYRRLDAFYQAVVGRGADVSALELLELCARARQPGCSGSGEAMRAQYVARGTGTDLGRLPTGGPGRVRPELTMRFLPQRFAYDAWVMSRTTAPGLEPPALGSRSMASPLDVAYALGSQRALVHLGADLALPRRERLPATLEAARRTLELHRPTAQAPSVYNHWLEALAALARPQTEAVLPRVLRTAPWHDRRLEAVLGSWAELRHDTVLVVEQSNGLEGCQYPEGYVEPVPELFAALGRAASGLERALAGGGYVEARVRQFLGHWQQQLARLERMAREEVAGRRLSRDDLAHLNQAVDQHRDHYGGARSYDGWYPKLFWTEGWQARDMAHLEGGLAKPVVADVHADLTAGRVSQVGVGNPALLVVALEVSGHVALYAGPVYSTFLFEQPLGRRMTDAEWAKRVTDARLPARPPFAAPYWSTTPKLSGRRTDARL